MHITSTSIHINLYPDKSYLQDVDPFLPPRNSIDTPKLKILENTPIQKLWSGGERWKTMYSSPVDIYRKRSTMNCTRFIREKPLTVAPERIWKWGWGIGPEQKWGDRSGAKRRKNFFSVVPLPFSALKAQLVVLVSAFVMVSTVWSVSCLLFFYSRCPRGKPFVKVGAHAPVLYWVCATEANGRRGQQSQQALMILKG